MNLLLDTHAFLWWVSDDPKLNAKARAAIADPNNLVFVSAATAWEISVKSSLGKLSAPDDYEAELQLHGLRALPVLNAHALAVKHLPLHHQDPFDRLLNSAGATRAADAGDARHAHEVVRRVSVDDLTGCFNRKV